MGATSNWCLVSRFLRCFGGINRCGSHIFVSCAIVSHRCVLRYLHISAIIHLGSLYLTFIKWVCSFHLFTFIVFQQIHATNTYLSHSFGASDLTSFFLIYTCIVHLIRVFLNILCLRLIKLQIYDVSTCVESSSLWHLHICLLRNLFLVGNEIRSGALVMGLGLRLLAVLVNVIIIAFFEHRKFWYDSFCITIVIR